MPSSSPTELLTGWFDRHRLAVDSCTAAVLAALCMLLGYALGGPLTSPPDGQGHPVAALVLNLLLAAPLALRRVRPVLCVVLVYGVALAHLLAGFVLVLPADLLVLLALYSVTVHGPRWAYRMAGAGAVAGSAVVARASAGLWDATPRVQAGVFVVLALLFATAWLLALVRRSRHDQVTALRDRADRLEREAEQQAQLAAAAERTRIAREMHDIVAHSLSVVVAQADGGRYAATSRPEAATRALATISETGRAALADMRRLLGVLRTGPAATAREATRPAAQDGPAPLAARSPQPDLDEIATLVDQVRAAGVRISSGTAGTRRALPPGAALTVYRVCQESLTNVLKHAGPDVEVSVMLLWSRQDLVLEVSDDGRGAAADDDGAGHGVAGMRERAAMFAGTLAAGPRPGGGYRVRLTLPLPEEHRS